MLPRWNLILSQIGLVRFLCCTFDILLQDSLKHQVDLLVQNGTQSNRQRDSKSNRRHRSRQGSHPIGKEDTHLRRRPKTPAFKLRAQSGCLCKEYKLNSSFYTNIPARLSNMHERYSSDWSMTPLKPSNRPARQPKDLLSLDSESSSKD